MADHPNRVVEQAAVEHVDGGRHGGVDELAAEQAYIDRAYGYLEAARVAATRLGSMVEVGRGGTEQARYERDVIWDTILNRLRELNLGDASLVFGRIDREARAGVPADANGQPGGRQDGQPGGRVGHPNGDVTVGPPGEGDAPGDGGDGPAGDTFYIGRLAVADEHQEPVVVDWRAPVAEPFYRATGRAPMGLARRRHFATRGRTLLGFEDEPFGDALSGIAGAGASSGDRGAPAGATAEPEATIAGRGALIAALETARTGRLTDIVATIQGEQDEVIRSELAGVLVVQGGPGTGKTVVALHRAAYLLYTHRFPLEGQGVLVVGPNRLFLGYIEQVLPSLGEAGVELAVLADLIPDRVRVQGNDAAVAARAKGDLRMADVIAKAVRDRRRPLRRDLAVGHGVQTLRVGVHTSARIVAEGRRRARTHNGARRFVEAALYEALAASGHDELDPRVLRDRVHDSLALREALEWMWPVLTPAQLLHDLFGSPALLRLAGGGRWRDDELAALHRPRSERAEDAVFTADDVPLLDEARALLGPRPGRRATDDMRTYGHIVVDEAQDLSPMQLRMLRRRSLNGSMTVVGDIAQATGAWAHAGWEEILAQLPAKRPPRRSELTIGYRIPAPNMALAARVLAVAAPGLAAPRSIRDSASAPRLVRAPTDDGLVAAVAAVTEEERRAVGTGNVAVICPASLVEAVSGAFDRAGIDHGRANRRGLDQQVTVVPVALVKGLELDASVVVEPAAIVDEETQGLRALYVALTRATKRLAIVHARSLPDALAG